MSGTRVEVEVLPHPYPYRCAFTICNDCDYMTRDTFVALHDFLNTSRSSVLGEGLGLPVADSLFMYSEREGALSYFSALDGTPGRDSGFLREAIEEGWIDSLHGYGDFVSSTVFSREMAVRALNELERKNIRLRTWIDHGSGDNSQNLALPNMLSQGDNPQHRSYHADLLRQYGLIFISGFNSDIIGQGGSRCHRAENLSQAGVPFRLAKRLHGRMFGKKLLKSKKLRDHSKVYGFFRSRNGVLRPDATTLSWQLQPAHIQKLIESGGTMVLYQHLGAEGLQPNRPPYLDADARRSLRDISDKFRNKMIWVAPTTEVLLHAHAVRSAAVDWSLNDGRLRLQLRRKREAALPLRATDLRNLSVRVRNYNGEQITVTYGKELVRGNNIRTVGSGEIIVTLFPSNREVFGERF